MYHLVFLFRAEQRLPNKLKGCLRCGKERDQRPQTKVAFYATGTQHGLEKFDKDIVL